MQDFSDEKSFTQQVCDEAQTWKIADKKSPARISYRMPSQKKLRNGG